MRIWLAPSANPPANSLGTQPQTRVATARQRAPVSGVAACPFDMMRIAMSNVSGSKPPA
jgi:hypothetical protein